MSRSAFDKKLFFNISLLNWNRVLAFSQLLKVPPRKSHCMYNPGQNISDKL